MTIEDGFVSLHRTVLFLEGNTFRVEGGTAPVGLELTEFGGTRYVMNSDGHHFTIAAVRSNGQLALFMGDSHWIFGLPNALSLAQEGGLSRDHIVAPMPNHVTVLSARTGQSVSQGDGLIVRAAMKIEHTLTTQRDRIVSEVLTKVGDQVEDSMLLLSLEEEV